MTVRSLFRSVLLFAACAVLGPSLGGCGRKAGLDLPPQAQADLAAAPPSILDDESTPLAPEYRPLATDPPKVAAAKARKRRIILDNLLD